MPDIYILHGPNLNLLGRRATEIYGTKSMSDYLSELRAAYTDTNIVFFQSNHEGKLIDYLQRSELTYSKGVVINPGALAHTSRALAEAVADLSVAVVEVHVSNIYARESWRAQSFLSERVRGVIAGLGLQGHAMAIDYLLAQP